MNSEKVKEIKELFKNCDFTLKHCGNCVLWKDEDCIETIKSKVITLINELESENERLLNEKWDKEDDLDNYHEENKQLKDRIAELEKENKELLKENEGCHGSYRCAIDKIGELSAERYIKVEQFAERLKEHPTMKIYSLHNACERIPKAIDETLNEFINNQ